MRILIAGHSFVRRFREYLITFNGLPRYYLWWQFLNFAPWIGLPFEDIFICGNSGQKADWLGLLAVRRSVDLFTPDILLIELGTNDLAQQLPCYFSDNICSAAVAGNIIHLCDDLYLSGKVNFFVICLVVQRRKLRGDLTRTCFDRRRKHFNHCIRELAKTRPYVLPYKHDRTILVNLKPYDTSNDDIHVTSCQGLRLYNFSIRKAVLMSLARV